MIKSKNVHNILESAARYQFFHVQNKMCGPQSKFSLKCLIYIVNLTLLNLTKLWLCALTGAAAPWPLQCNPLRYQCVDQGAAAPCTPALGAIIREIPIWENLALCVRSSVITVILIIFVRYKHEILRRNY
jgi:hypothetical protein